MTIDTATINEAIDLRDLAAMDTELHRESANELSGGCPKCGGDDRFHVKRGWFFCRQCNERGGDAIAYVRWMQSVGFREACEMLESGVTMPTVTQRRPAPTRKRTAKPKATFDRDAAGAMMLDAQKALLPEDGPGRQYLERRGLGLAALLAYGLGYVKSAPLPGMLGKQLQPAIAIPWYLAGKLVAVRYRFLEMHTYVDSNGRDRKARQTALSGSRFVAFFGAQAKPMPHKLRTLVVCEGELNAISIWQVAHDSGVDVLSLGSETSGITDSMTSIASQYGTVIIWADRMKARSKDEVPPARRWAKALGGFAFASDEIGGKDANDLLQLDALGGVLAVLRHKFVATADRERLLWDLWDSAEPPASVDAGTAKVIRKLADELGKGAAMEEAAPGRWETA